MATWDAFFVSKKSGGSGREFDPRGEDCLPSEQTGAQVLELRGDLGPNGFLEAHRAAGNFVAQVVESVAGLKGVPSLHQEKQDAPRRPQVRGEGVTLLQQHLRGHVEWCACGVLLLGAGVDAAQAEIDHLEGRFRGLVRLQKVVRLNVPVKDLLLVALADKLSDVHEVDTHILLAEVRVGLGVVNEVATRAVLL